MVRKETANRQSQKCTSRKFDMADENEEMPNAYIETQCFEWAFIEWETAMIMRDEL
ncbi:hypothetical protein J6590_002954 [Homalodisca vitripennis]|nr:hypothetical protein J6590_002954 [Homalodisca vitripennis]